VGRRNQYPMSREYELTFIVRIDPSEEVMKETINQVHAFVEEEDKGKVVKADHWGRRRLAYEIDGQREGYYVCMEAEIDPSHVEELERNLKLNGDILRYLLVRPE